MATKLVQVRLDADLVKEVDHLAVDEDRTRTETVERLLRQGLRSTQGSGSNRREAHQV